MHVFETVLALLLGATVLRSLAGRLGVPYPTLLAAGGALLAFLPDGPRLELPPELILALFVAPVLLDAAYDASFRDLRRNWLAVGSLVLVAVGLTTVAVAIVARLLFPDMPWGAAVALGALLAPPDAVAALAVLRQIEPPHRIRMVLEGESLLNDASSLLIYRLAVTTVAVGGFSAARAAPTFALVFVGSVVVGWLLARGLAAVMAHLKDPASTAIVQFVTTFGAWLLAERLGLSGVITVVVMGLAVARGNMPSLPARLRVPSFAIWETATVVMNVLVFTLIGLQLRPILQPLSEAERAAYLSAGLAILAVVIGVRLAWVLAHHGAVVAARRIAPPRADDSSPPATLKDAVVVGWSGMRGIVTLAAAIALPVGFPYRDFIQLTAFVVVLGTLVVQGLTLAPLLRLLKLPRDTLVQREVAVARKAALKAALRRLQDDPGPAAERLRQEYAEALDRARHGADARATAENRLRVDAVQASRAAIADLRRQAVIGDDAYRRVEEELDWEELSAGDPQRETPPASERATAAPPPG